MQVLMQVAHNVRRLVYRPALAVQVLVATDRGDVVLVRNTYGDHQLHLPGGALRRGETVRAAGSRELREETGLQVDRLLVTALLLRKLPVFGYQHVALLSSPQTVEDPTSSRRRTSSLEVSEVAVVPADKLPSDVSATTARIVSAWASGNMADLEHWSDKGRKLLDLRR